MKEAHSIHELLLFLASLYAKESNPAGPETAKVLRNTTTDQININDKNQSSKLEIIKQALAIDPIDNSQIIQNALPYIQWFEPAVEIANLKAEKSAKMIACELLGPDGMVANDQFRVGLYIQLPNLNYTTRTHAAEETYIALGGVGFWGINNEMSMHRKTGDIIHHPSMIPHHNLTKEQPMIAAWRWSGDISFDHYYTD